MSHPSTKNSLGALPTNLHDASNGEEPGLPSPHAGEVAADSPAPEEAPFHGTPSPEARLKVFAGAKPSPSAGMKKFQGFNVLQEETVSLEDITKLLQTGQNQPARQIYLMGLSQNKDSAPLKGNLLPPSARAWSRVSMRPKHWRPKERGIQDARAL